MPEHFRTLIACAIALLVPSMMASAVAAEDGSQFTLGLAAGPNFSALTGAEVLSGTSVSTGTETGFVVEAHIAKELGAKASGVLGLGFVRKGGGVKYTGVDAGLPHLSTQYDNKLTLDYVELSLRFRYAVVTSNSIRVLLLAGPALGINVKAEYDLTAVDIDSNAGTSDPWDEKMDVKDRIKKTEVSGVGGVRLEKAFEDFTIGASALYSLGFTDFADSPDPVNIDYEITSGKNSGFAATIGVGFHI